MIAALIDNGSLEPGAHRNLRALAAALSERSEIAVAAVSWKHSDQIRAGLLDGTPAATLGPWLRKQIAGGEREFIFIPFFISEQGAIGSALGRDIETLQHELGSFRFAFTAGLGEQGALAYIVAARIREIIAERQLTSPPVIVVDHGGPSPASAAVRNGIASTVRHMLGTRISLLAAASLEGADYDHNRPLFADALGRPEFNHGDVVIAPLFLAPGRHAGPHGDLAQIAEAAEDRLTAAPLTCHFTELVGTHPYVMEVLADALTRTVATFHVAA